MYKEIVYFAAVLFVHYYVSLTTDLANVVGEALL